MSQIGKYRLSERIGAGAMGEVFRAHDTVLDRPVALKIISGGDDDKRQRFRREAQSAARLAHPNIVVVHDFGEEEGRFFMAMELLDGSDLKRVISSNLLPDLASRLAVMEQICDAVAFAHAVNISSIAISSRRTSSCCRTGEACLLHTIEQMAGSSFNLDVKLAWTAIYNFIAQTMIEASLESA